MQYRFDLGVKYYYAKCYRKGIQCNYPIDLYRQLIRSFSNGIEIARDDGKHDVIPSKKGLDDFVRKFNELIDSITKGFDPNHPIPQSKQNQIITDGSHRLAVCLCLGVEPIFQPIDKVGCTNWNYQYFMQYSPHYHLPAHSADTIALNNLELMHRAGDDRVRSIVVYASTGAAGKYQDVENIIRSYGVIMYRKIIPLTLRGQYNLIKELYRGEPWVGGVFPPTNDEKYRNYTSAHHPIRFYLFHFNNGADDKEMKRKIRDIYKINNYSIHATDQYVDTFRTATALLNENSIHFLNRANTRVSSKTKNSLTSYFNTVKTDEDYMLTGSVVMELYGLRAANDVDYISRETTELKLEGVGRHKAIWLDYYHAPTDELLYNPTNYFYFNGHKCLSLSALKLMKSKRGEPKDLKDVVLIG